MHCGDCRVCGGRGREGTDGMACAVASLATATAERALFGHELRRAMAALPQPLVYLHLTQTWSGSSDRRSH